MHHGNLSPKFPEEETCSLAQSEWSELNPCRSAITPALSQRVGVMSFIDRAGNEVRVLNVVPCITAIDYPKFLEEETCSPAQSERSELSARSKNQVSGGGNLLSSTE